MGRAPVIAILGAQGTGKTTLARALSHRMGELSGLRCTWVPDALHEWRQRHGRSPHADEMAAVAVGQQSRLDAAAAAHELVVADTTPLMIAVASVLRFDDRSLLAMAVAAQRRCALTLLTALDLPAGLPADPSADPAANPRDGPPAPASVQRQLRALLSEQRIDWSLVGGLAEARTEAALDAAAPLVATLLRQRARTGAGLFSRLAARDAAGAHRPWSCENCDVPECEHLALRPARRAPAGAR